MAHPIANAPTSEPRRVLWMELFFDLIFAAFITQLALGLHGDLGWAQFAIFAGLYIPTWWAWVNMMMTINVASFVSERRISFVLLLGTFFVGMMAAAAPEAAGEHAWAFALGNAGVRLAILPIWIAQARRQNNTYLRPLVYNGFTALLWLASIWVPQPAQYLVWAAAIIIEASLLSLRRRGSPSRLLDILALDHIGERMGLFTLIVLGESLIVSVSGLSEHWTVMSGVTAVLGFVLIGSIAWTFLLYITKSIETGLEGLRERRDAAGLRDTVMYLPYFLVVGITMVAAGLSIALSHPDHHLPVGAAIALGGGLALFYLTNLVVGLRYQQPARSVLVWSLPSAIAALVLIPVAAYIPAVASVGLAAAIVVANVIYSELTRLRMQAQ